MNVDPDNSAVAHYSIEQIPDFTSALAQGLLTNHSIALITAWMIFMRAPEIIPFGKIIFNKLLPNFSKYAIAVNSDSL